MKCKNDRSRTSRAGLLGESHCEDIGSGQSCYENVLKIQKRISMLITELLMGEYTLLMNRVPLSCCKGERGNGTALGRGPLGEVRGLRIRIEFSCVSGVGLPSSSVEDNSGNVKERGRVCGSRLLASDAECVSRFGRSVWPAIVVESEAYFEEYDRGGTLVVMIMLGGRRSGDGNSMSACDLKLQASEFVSVGRSSKSRGGGLRFMR